MDMSMYNYITMDNLDHKWKGITKLVSFSNLLTIALFVTTVIVTLSFTSLNTTKTISSRAQMTSCTIPGGCGGNCDPNQNMGCGYGGCRSWEYCADENRDSIYSCYDTTNLGSNQPDYSRACGHDRANQIYPSITVPTAIISVRVPNVRCNNALGCGGNCNPTQDGGCGYGGCRSWEYCADENRDGVYSCYDTTNLGRNAPDARACGNQIAVRPSGIQPTVPLPSPTSSLIPTQPIISVTPTIPLSITPTSGNLVTPTPTVVISTPVATDTPAPTVTPSVSPTPAGTEALLDFSKLCMPLEVNGSQADKMDMMIIPLNFKDDVFETEMPLAANRAKESLRRTNLNNYENEVLKKMNWYVLNIYHPDFDEGNLNGTYDGTKNGIFNFALNYANYCGKDRFMVIFKTESPELISSAIVGYGGLVFTTDLMQSDQLVFAHEWGHAVGDLVDEYLSGEADPGINCTDEGTQAAQTATICAANNPDPTCISEYDNPAFKTACPAWDCNFITCSPLARELLKDTGCYPKCGVGEHFRPAYNSTMRWQDYSEGQNYNGPSLVHMIEKVFSQYR